MFTTLSENQCKVGRTDTGISAFLKVCARCLEEAEEMANENAMKAEPINCYFEHVRDDRGIAARER